MARTLNVTPPRPDLIRQPQGGFGWLDDRLLRERWLARLGPEATAVLVLLALAADRQGVSFYGRDRMAEELCLTRQDVDRALSRLIGFRLVAHRPWRPGQVNGVWQLLPVPQTSAMPVPQMSATPLPQMSATPLPRTSAMPVPQTSATPVPTTSVMPVPQTSPGVLPSVARPAPLPPQPQRPTPPPELPSPLGPTPTPSLPQDSPSRSGQPVALAELLKTLEPPRSPP